MKFTEENHEEINEFLSELTPDDCGRVVLGCCVVRFEGFSGLCLEDVDRRTALPEGDPDHVGSLDDALEETLEDLIAREGRAALDSGVMPGEEPIVYAIFPPEPEVGPAPGP